jgi:electron transport complex protein RnfG
MTVEKIKFQMENLENESLKSVLPEASDFSKKIKGKTMEYYEGKNNGDLVGYAFIGEGKGYSGPINIMIGVDKDGKTLGIKIISQRETPGLGSRVEEVKGGGTVWDVLKGKKIEKTGEPWFQKQFKEKPINEIDIITGATITSKAVINAVKDTIDKFMKEEIGRAG